MIKVHGRHLDQCQQSSGCASNRAPGASQPWVRAGWVWSWTMPIWGVLGALLISPAWRSSALINVALGLVRFPMFQHLTGCNLIFPLHTHDGSEPAQVKFVFDSTAGLLPRFTTTEKKSQIPVLLIIWHLWNSHSGWDANTVRHGSGKMNLLLKSLFLYWV